MQGLEVELRILCLKCILVDQMFKETISFCLHNCSKFTDFNLVFCESDIKQIYYDYKQ